MNVPILIIEDDEAIGAALEDFLTSEGFRVSRATEGLRGLELSRKTLPSAIILDLAMPGLHGREVLRRVKADPLTVSIPIIVTSGESDQRALPGAARLMTKPYSLVDMLAVLTELVAERAARHAHETQ